MKNKLFLSTLFKYCINLFRKKNIFFGHGTYNAYTESIHLIYSVLNININIKYSKIKYLKINNTHKKKIIYLAKLRIKKKIPIAYLTKKIWFCNKKFYINYGALIPRSPIAEIIKKKFKFIKKNFYPKNILDLCTGSGCIAICCSYIFPKSKIDAIDISKKALKIAKKNIIIHKKNKQIKLIKSNLFKKINKKYDLIICNPPYINKKDIKFLPKEYSYEPEIALISKKKGIYMIQKILKKSYKYLTHKGYLICETGHQNKKIINKNKSIKFNWIKFKNKNHKVFIIKKNKLTNIK